MEMLTHTKSSRTIFFTKKAKKEANHVIFTLFLAFVNC